jgi:carbon-monoxide dehydrogenase large subunit
MAATRHQCGRWRPPTRTAGFIATESDTPRPSSAPISRPSPRVPTYLDAPLLSGQYDIAGAIYCEVDGVYTTTAPVDAYRGAGRPEALRGRELVEKTARANCGQTRGRASAAKTTSRSSAHATASRPTTRATMPPRSTRRWRLPTTRISRKEAEECPRWQAAGIGFSSYIEVAASHRRRRRSLGAGVGLWEVGRSARQPDGTVEVTTVPHQSCDGPRDHLRPTGFDRHAHHNRSRQHRPRRHGQRVQFGMGTTARACGVCRDVCHRKASDK